MIEITDLFDKKKWDNFVFNHPHGNIFQTSYMAEVYRSTKNYEPISLMALDSRSGDILAILQAVVIREMKGRLGSFSARSIINGGPIFIDSDEGLEAIGKLMEYYEHFIQKKVIYTQIRNLWEIENYSSIFDNAGYSHSSHLNYLIDLNRNEEDIWKNIHKSRRKGINRAKAKGIEIEPLTNERDIAPFYRIIEETYKDVGLPLADITLFNSAFKILVPNNMARFYIAKYNDTVVGARVVLLSKGFVHDWYAGSLKSHSNMYINEGLVWHILKEYANKGYNLFDFGGAGKPEEEYGVREFKRRFGGDLVNFGRFEKTHSEIKKKAAGVGFKVYKKLTLHQ